MLVDLRSFDPDLTGQICSGSARQGGHYPQPQPDPGDPRSPFVTSGLRIGTARRPRRHARAEMIEIAELVRRVLADPGDELVRAAVREEVAALCSKFVPYP